MLGTGDSRRERHLKIEIPICRPTKTNRLLAFRGQKGCDIIIPIGLYPAMRYQLNIRCKPTRHTKDIAGDDLASRGDNITLFCAIFNANNTGAADDFYRNSVWHHDNVMIITFCQKLCVNITTCLKNRHMQTSLSCGKGILIDTIMGASKDDTTTRCDPKPIDIGLNSRG